MLARRLLNRFYALAAASALLSQALPARSAEPAPPPEPARASLAWRNEVIYLVMIDRFANGDRRNDGAAADPKNPFAFHGGDLAGLVGRLDYLRDLGITTLWITPVNENQAVPHMGKYWPYHGYWIANWEKVDPHFGDEALLARLVREAHARQIKVLLDCVVNHAGYEAPIVRDPHYAAWFHHNGAVTDWFDPYQNENFDIVGLPDFNTENKDFLAFQERVWTGWFRRTGIDGLRIDTVRHVPLAFWHHFNATLHALPNHPLLLGEVSYHTPEELAPYQRQGGLDSLFDFPLFFTIQDVFAHGGSMKAIPARLAQDARYANASMLSTFIDNHDYPRFFTTAGNDIGKERLALAFLLTVRGIPSLYYGTEVAMPGGDDPDNRRDMAWGSNPAMLAYTRQLVHLRRTLPCLSVGDWHTVFVDDTAIAYTRGSGQDAALVVLNNSPRARTLELAITGQTAFGNGVVLANRLGRDAATVRAGHLRVTLGAREAKIYVPTRETPRRPTP